MCKALLWFIPAFGRSLSVQVIVFAIRMWKMILTGGDGEVSNDTCVWPRILRTGSLTVALRCHVLGLLIVDKIHIIIGAVLIQFVGVHPQR